MNAMQLMRPSRPVRAVRVCAQSDNNKSKGESRTTRRELALRSVNLLALAAMFTWGASPTPSNIGLSDYGEFKSLALCPPSPNCISTSEEANDMTHYVPQWTYNPEEGRGTKNPATQEQAMNEHVEVVESTAPDGFTPKIVKRTAVGVSFSFLLVSSRLFSFLAGRSSGEQRRPGVGLLVPRSLTRAHSLHRSFDRQDYLHVEYESPTFGFIDDFEAYFPATSKAGSSIVEYRSASRIGESDGDINRKRIRELRKALTSKYGWKSIGY